MTGESSGAGSGSRGRGAPSILEGARELVGVGVLVVAAPPRMLLHPGDDLLGEVPPELGRVEVEAVLLEGQSEGPAGREARRHHAKHDPVLVGRLGEAQAAQIPEGERLLRLLARRVLEQGVQPLGQRGRALRALLPHPGAEAKLLLGHDPGEVAKRTPQREPQHRHGREAGDRDEGDERAQRPGQGAETDRQPRQAGGGAPPEDGDESHAPQREPDEEGAREGPDERHEAERDPRPDGGAVEHAHQHREHRPGEARGREEVEQSGVRGRSSR